MSALFRRVKGICGVIPFKGACALNRGAPLTGDDRVGVGALGGTSLSWIEGLQFSSLSGNLKSCSTFSLLMAEIFLENDDSLL